MTSEFESLGLSRLEEGVYRWLVSHGQSSLSEIARGAGIALAQARATADLLEQKGMVVREKGRPARFTALPPELALATLVSEREHDLQRARQEVGRLQDRFRQAAGRRDTSDVVEVVQGPEAVKNAVAKLGRLAKSEVLVFDKPPYTSPPEEWNIEEPQLASGVTFRSIYSPQSLEVPGSIGLIEKFIRAGEEARVYPALPMKLIIFDRRFAAVPLSEDDETVASALVAHSSGLLRSFVRIFEDFWVRAFPLQVGALHSLPVGAPTHHLPDEDLQLASLLLAGSKAEALARELKMGTSTLERRIKRLMRALGADNRVQLGYELARRGLLESEELPHRSAHRSRLA